MAQENMVKFTDRPLTRCITHKTALIIHRNIYIVSIPRIVAYRSFVKFWRKMRYQNTIIFRLVIHGVYRMLRIGVCCRKHVVENREHWRLLF